MVQPQQTKSRRYRRVFVRVPSGQVKLHYRERKTNYAQCGDCGAKLYTISRSVKAYKLFKSSRTPQRPNPHLCSRCSRKTIREAALQ